MATALNLFPARVRFVNSDGTLTPEAYRALQSLVSRTGGVIGGGGGGGEQTVDLLGFVLGLQNTDASTVMPPAQEAVVQPIMPAMAMMPMDWQGPSQSDFMCDLLFQDIP